MLLFELATIKKALKFNDLSAFTSNLISKK